MFRNQLCIWMSSVQFGLKNLSHPSLHEFRGKKKMRRKGWLSFADTLVLSSAGKGRTMAFQSSHVLPLDGVEATSVASKVFLVPLFFCRHENSILLLVVELGWLGCLTFLCSPTTMKSVNFKEVSNVPFSPDWSRDKEITDLSDWKRDTIKSLSPRAKRGW